MRKVKMLKGGVPLHEVRGVFMPQLGEEVEVSDDVAAALIRGGDAEEVVPRRKSRGASPNKKVRNPVFEDK